MTPLRSFFERIVPFTGTKDTVKVANPKVTKSFNQKELRTDHTANYKMLV